jgi:hypothetical protein
LQTAKPRNKRRTIILAVIAIAVIVGAAAGIYFFVIKTGLHTSSGDFTLAVYQGNPNSASSTWSPVTNETILLNGTSISLVVEASVPPLSSFNSIIQLSFNSPVSGVTGLMPRATVHPLTGGFSTTGLNLTAASNVPVQKLGYNFTVTGTGGGITHVATFPLTIRNSVLRIDPSSVQTTKNGTFNVSIGVSDIYSLYGFQFTLHYNASLIRADNYSMPNIFYAIGTNLTISHGNTYPVTGPGIPCDSNYFLHPCNAYSINSTDNTNGRIMLASTLIGNPCGPFAVPCVDSPGTQVTTLANVTFTGNSTNAGLTSLTLTDTVLTLLHGSASIVEVDPNIGFHLFTASASVFNRTSTTSVSCVPSSGSGAAGFTTICTATVTDASPGVVNATGMVYFYNFTKPIQSCTLNPMSNGVSSCHVPFAISPMTTSGTPEMVIADYLGDKSHGPSSGQFSVTVT